MVSQSGILEPVSTIGRYVEFSLIHGVDPKNALKKLEALNVEDTIVIGLGAGFIHSLGGQIPNLRAFPSLSGPGCDIPSTQADIWCWFRGSTPGSVADLSRTLIQRLAPEFIQRRLVDGFVYKGGRDLSGYEDGTENPEGDDAVKAAIVQGMGDGLDGSSFVAVQKWLHDLAHFKSLSQNHQDDVIGRRLKNNDEFDEAPASAHVKRTAQESFDPEAFILRRSMPWSDADGEGLMFVAFGNSFDAFEAQLKRMTGQEDGITDGLFEFSRPITGGYYWCPPVVNDKLNLSVLGAADPNKGCS